MKERLQIVGAFAWLGFKLLLMLPFIVTLYCLLIAMFIIELSVGEVLVYFPIWVFTGKKHRLVGCCLIDDALTFLANNIVFT